MAEKVRIGDLPLAVQMCRSLFHVEHVPEHDGRNNQVEGHGAFLLRSI